MAPSTSITTEVICLVDDDRAVLTSISRLLASEGIAVRAFDDPEAFLAHAKEHFVPLAILDIWMERLTGIEVQAKLARLSPKTRVIVMTGRKDPAAEQTVLEFGARAFFTKPFDDEEFLRAVRRALSLPS